ncbi:hypothetical protein PF010_g24685 [Phytophthora fragariae]|uniref:Uncharacterized protein n=1 Tax=Phytophthora fragariae TaxID=53985 RepID=A0A6G0K1W6_9STRA|nr:hypothetical protein PF010_g24685 [Phytophthora fragariae]
MAGALVPIVKRLRLGFMIGIALNASGFSFLWASALSSLSSAGPVRALGGGRTCHWPQCPNPQNT